MSLNQCQTNYRHSPGQRTVTSVHGCIVLAVVLSLQSASPTENCTFPDIDAQCISFLLTGLFCFLPPVTHCLRSIESSVHHNVFFSQVSESPGLLESVLLTEHPEHQQARNLPIY